MVPKAEEGCAQGHLLWGHPSSCSRALGSATQPILCAPADTLTRPFVGDAQGRTCPPALQACLWLSVIMSKTVSLLLRPGFLIASLPADTELLGWEEQPALPLRPRTPCLFGGLLLPLLCSPCSSQALSRSSLVDCVRSHQRTLSESLTIQDAEESCLLVAPKAVPSQCQRQAFQLQEHKAAVNNTGP